MTLEEQVKFLIVESKTIESIFPDGFEKGILNTDRWAAQLKTNRLKEMLFLL